MYGEPTNNERQGQTLVTCTYLVSEVSIWSNLTVNPTQHFIFKDYAVGYNVNGFQKVLHCFFR